LPRVVQVGQAGITLLFKGIDEENIDRGPMCVAHSPPTLSCSDGDVHRPVSVVTLAERPYSSGREADAPAPYKTAFDRTSRLRPLIVALGRARLHLKPARF